MMHSFLSAAGLVLANIPFAFAFTVIVMTTHILEGSPTDAGGMPLFLIAFIAGCPIAAAMHMFVLPRNSAPGVPKSLGGAAGGAGSGGGGGHSMMGMDNGSVGQSLLGPDGMANHSSSSSGGGGAAAASSNGGGHGAAAAGTADSSAVQHHHHKKAWARRFGTRLAGPNTEPLPTGVTFSTLLLLSFAMSLFWLLIIANEIVGTAICFGKVLGVPDVVMGLTVLAIG